MRIIKDIENINYNQTKDFFQKRAAKINMYNPYSVTMYQDNNKELVEQRNLKEITQLKPLLKLNPKSKVLDLACGIGRWGDAITEDIDIYCGIDFSEELINIAHERNKKENFLFYSGAADKIDNIIKKNNLGTFNVILMIGILMYLNDKDLIKMFQQVLKNCENNSIICIREPVSLGDRITLKNFYSEELKDNYNAIYRNRNEIKNFLNTTFIENNYKIIKEDFLFKEENLNNRKETRQYFYILERKNYV